MNHPRNHKEPWYARLAQALGINPESRRGRSAAAVTSKHGRARTKPHDWRRREKVRRRMAAASRRINRERQT